MRNQVNSISDLGKGPPATGNNPVFTTTGWRIDVSTTSGVDVRSYGAVGDGVADDTTALLNCFAAEDAIWIPDGTFRYTTWLPMRSNQTIRGNGASSILFNDKSNATIDKRACLLPGNHHPVNMATQTSYALNTIAYGDPSVICTTAGDATNVTVDELVIVGSATNLLGVSRHAQLNKISGISAGTITLVDPIEATMTDARLWKIGGTDVSTGTPIYAVENILVENLGFMGRSALASKDAVFGGTFRDLTMLDVANFMSVNLMSNVTFERLRGSYCSRYLEFAFNSYNVTARDWKGRFTPPAGLQTGESMVLPIQLGEQAYRILLDDVQCHIDPLFTTATNLAQLKGSKLTMRKNDWRFNASAGSVAISIPDSAYTGFPVSNITFEECRLAAPGKARIVQIGGAAVAPENPQEVHFRGGELVESVTGESIWFQAGTGFSCSMRDRTGKAVKISGAARYPALNGYRRG